MRAVCQQCGLEFEALRSNRRYCPACAAKRILDIKREYARTHPRECSRSVDIGGGKTLGDANRAAFPPTLYAIQHARTKPIGCSDARWRMELARRRNSAWYEAAPDADDVRGSGGREIPPVKGHD